MVKSIRVIGATIAAVTLSAIIGETVVAPVVIKMTVDVMMAAVENATKKATIMMTTSLSKMQTIM